MFVVINKVDFLYVYFEEMFEEIESFFGLEKSKYMWISVKSGLGVEGVLDSIIEGLLVLGMWVGGEDGKFRGLIFDILYV